MNYPAYPDYKSSGVEWFSKIPADWESVALRWLCKRYAGGTPDKENSIYWENGSVPWINSGEVNQICIHHPTTFITEEGFQNSSARWIPKGALVMALAGQGKTKGMVAQLAIDTTGNQSLAAIVPFEKIESRFLFWWLSSQYNAIRNLAGGDQRDGLNLDLLGSIPCPLPSRTEQRKVSNFLDCRVRQIDSLISKKIALVERLKERRSALISRVVNLGLPPSGAGSAGLDPRPKLKPSGVDWLSEIPEHWDISKFSRVAKIAEGQVDPEQEPFLSMLLIAPNHVESQTGRLIERQTAAEQSAESGKYLCRKGDVIYSKIRPALAKATIAPTECLCSADMYPIRGSQKMTNGYLFWLLLSRQFTAWSVLEADRVAMPKINRESLSELWLPTPPIEEQMKIVHFLDAETLRMDKIIIKVELAIDQLTEHREAIITSAVTGSIDVRNVVT